MPKKPSPFEDLLNGLGVPPDAHATAYAFGDQVAAAQRDLIPALDLLMQHVHQGDYEAAAHLGTLTVDWLNTLDRTVLTSLTIQLGYLAGSTTRRSRRGRPRFPG